MTTRIIKAFEKEVNLTEEGILALVQAKSFLVFELTTKSGMTLARKERTERNKLIDQVKRVSIDTENAIKAKRASIIEQITSAYNCIVEPFEKEELRLKQEKEKAAKIEEDRIAEIKNNINEMRSFTYDIKSKDSQFISDVIEAVDMIDVEVNFAEFTQEALQAKKETLGELNIALSGAIQSEQLAADRKKLDDDKAEFEAWKASQNKTEEQPEVHIDLAEGKDETMVVKRNDANDGFVRMTSKELMIADVVQWGNDHSISNGSMDELAVIIDKYMQ